MQRLERKVAAGAQFFMTQPVFDVDLVREMQRRSSICACHFLQAYGRYLVHARQNFCIMKCRELLFLIRCALSWQYWMTITSAHTGCKLPKRLLLQHSDISLASLITPFLHYKATTELAKFAWSL